MTRVALIFGGHSPEHEVSIVSARNVYEQLRLADYTVEPVGIDRNGGWHVGPDAFDDLCKGLPANPPRRTLADLEVDVVFPMIHGVGGEDGSIQGYCQMLELPYVGGDALNNSLCWDKLATRAVLLENHIPQPPYLPLYRNNFSAETTLSEVAERFDFPVFVKPARTGSSIGITRVTREQDLIPAIENAFRYDYRILLEPGLVAREIEIAGLGGPVPQLSIPAEIIPENDFYDFEEKYLKNSTTFSIPAKLDKPTLAKVHRFARDAWLALNCYGMGRIDFLITDDQVYLNEINTCPGFTGISMYPRLFRESGVSGPELMRRLVTLALERDKMLPVTSTFITGDDWYKES